MIDINSQERTQEEKERLVELLAAQDPDKEVDNKLPFTPEFTLDVLGSLITNPQLMGEHFEYLRPNHFLADTHQLIYGIARDHWKQYKKLPTYSFIENELAQRLDGKDEALVNLYRAELRTIKEYHEHQDWPEPIDAKLRLFEEVQETKLATFSIMKGLKAGTVAPEKIDQSLTKLIADRQRIRTGCRASAQWIDLLQFKNRAEAQRPDWLVPGWLQEKRLHLITGREKSGKSTLLWKLVTSLVSGTPWLGTPVRQTPVVYLDYENGDDYAWDNMLANLDAENIDPATVAPFWRTVGPPEPGQPPLLPAVLTADWLRANIPTAFDGVMPVVIVDAARPAFTGMFSEANWDHSASEVDKALVPLRQLCHEIGMTCVLIHHDNKQGSFAGSFAWRSNVDQAWGLTRPEDSQEATLKHIGRVVKQTEALIIVKEGSTITLKGTASQVSKAEDQAEKNDDDGIVFPEVPVGSLASNRTTVANLMTVLVAKISQKRVRAALDRLVKAGRIQSHQEKPNSPAYYWRYE